MNYKERKADILVIFFVTETWYGVILCDDVEEEEKERKLQITVGICRRRQKKQNICPVEIASCAALLCFELETVQVVLLKLVAGMSRLLPFHAYNLIRS